MTDVKEIREATAILRVTIRDYYIFPDQNIAIRIWAVFIIEMGNAPMIFFVYKTGTTACTAA